MDFLTLFISLRCTQACAHCLYGCSPERGEHMSWDVFTKSVEVAKESQIPTLNFFGGEPFLNPRFLTMIQTILQNGFDLMIATNCRPLAKEEFLADFLDVTKQYKERIYIYTARDQFHLRYFDPIEIANHLLSEGYKVAVQDFSNYTVALSEYNVNNPELRRLNTHWSCCEAKWTDYLGVLPDGGWTICPPSLEAFGNIFSDSIEEILKFKSGLSLHYEKGCTECLKDFKQFHREFEIGSFARELQSQFKPFAQ